MPKIEAFTALQNNYNKISKLCHETGEPVFITVNGKCDLVVMSIETFEQRERTLGIRERLLEAQLQKIKGVPPLDLNESMRELGELVNGQKEE